MVSKLEEIVSSFNNVDISKSTDRKDLIKKIQSLLGSKDVCKKITENSNNKNEKNFLTWRFILKIAIKIFNFDTSNVLGPKVKTTKRKSFDSINLIKLVFKLSSQDKPSLSTPIVMRFIGDVLETRILSDFCGNELLSTVFNYHFCYREVWLSAGSQLVFDFLNRLLTTYKDCLTSPQSSLDVTALSRYINTSIDNASSMLSLADDLFVRQGFETLQHSLNTRRQLQLIEFDLRSINTMMTSFMFDFCDVVCEAGEEVFNALLLLWSSQPSERIKIDMINFFHLQIIMHNPHTHHERDSGRWMGYLKSLMRVLLEDVANLTFKHKFLTGFNGNREFDFVNQFFDLFSSVFLLLMGEGLEDGSVEEVDEPVCKRRKKQVLSFSWLRDQLVESKSPQGALPWLCIMAKVLSKKRKVMEEEEVVQLLKAVSTYIRQGGTVLTEALVVVGEFIKGSMSHHFYNDVAMLIEKKLTIQPDQQDCFNFLTLMIIHKPDLYKPSNEFISLFQLASPKHSLQPIMFLYHLCNSYKFLNEVSFKSRLSLLQWILPGFNFPDNDFTAEPHKNAIFLDHISTISHVITMLCTPPNNLPTTDPSFDPHIIGTNDDIYLKSIDRNNKSSNDTKVDNDKENSISDNNNNMDIKNVMKLWDQHQNPLYANAKWLLCSKTCYFPVFQAGEKEDDDDEEEDSSLGEIITGKNDKRYDTENISGNIGSVDKIVGGDGGGLRGDDGGDVVACLLSYLCHQLDSLKSNKIEKHEVKSHMNIVWLCVHLMTHPLSQLSCLSSHVHSTLSSLSECLEILLASSGAEDQAEVLAIMCSCPSIPRRYHHASSTWSTAVPVQFLSVIIDYAKKLILKNDEATFTSSPTQFFGIEDDLGCTALELEEKTHLDLNDSMFDPKLTGCVGPRRVEEGGVLTSLFSPRHSVVVEAVNFFMRNIDLFKKHENMLFEFVASIISSDVPSSLRISVIHCFLTTLKDDLSLIPTTLISTIVTISKRLIAERHTDESSVETALKSLLHLSKQLSRCTMEAHTSSQNTDSQPLLSTHQLLPQQQSSQQLPTTTRDELFSCIAILFSFSDIYNPSLITLLSDLTLKLIKEKVIPRDYLYDVSEESQRSRTLLEVISPLLFRRHFVVRYQFCRIFASLLNSNGEADKHISTITKKHAEFLFHHVYQFISDEKCDPSTVCHLLLMVWRNSIHLRSLVIHTLIQSPSIHPSFPHHYIINTLKCLAEIQEKTTIASFIGDYLGNITKTFLRNNTPIHHFPHHLLLYPSFHLFFRSESSHIVPVFFLGSKYLKQLNQAIEDMNEDKEEYIKRYLLDVLVLIIPYYVLKKSPMISEGEVLSRNVKKAVSSYNILINIYSLKNLSMLVERNLAEVLYRVFRMYFDPSDYAGVYSSDSEINESNISLPTSILTLTKPIISSFLSYLVSSSKATNILQLLSLSKRDGLQTIIVKLTSDFIQASNLSSKCHHLHALICFLSCVKEHLCRDESLPFVIVHLSVFVANLFSSIFFKKKYIRQGREKREVEHMVVMMCVCYKDFYAVAISAHPMLTRRYSACVTSALWELSSLGNQEEVKDLLNHIDHWNTIPDGNSSLEDSLKNFYTSLHNNHTSFLCGFPPTRTLHHLLSFLSQNCIPENENLTLSEIKLKILNLLLRFITTLHPPPFSFFKHPHISTSRQNNHNFLPETEHLKREDYAGISHHQFSFHHPHYPPFHHHTTLHHNMRQHQLEFHKEVISCIGLLCSGVVAQVSNPFDYCDNNKTNNNINWKNKNKISKKTSDVNDDDDDGVINEVVDKFLLQNLNSVIPEVVHTTCECLKQLLSDTKISLMIKNKFIKNNEEKEDDEEDKNSEIIDSGDFANERYKLLLPFFLEKARNKTEKHTKRLRDVFTDPQVWLKSGSALVQRIVLGILGTEEFSQRVFYSSIFDVCRQKTDICSFILPSCIHQSLMNDSSLSEEISKQLNMIVKEFNACHSGISRSSVVDILQTLEYLRTKTRPHAKTPWDNQFWLQLDLLELSKASLKAGLHHSALFFTEILCLQESCSEDIEDIWLEAYEALALIDCLQACSKRRLLDPFKKLKVLQAEGRWQESLTLCDLLGGRAEVHKLTALQSLECNNLLQEYLHGRGINGLNIEMTSEETEMRYKMASQLSTWNLSISHSPSSGFHQLLYNCQYGILRHQPSITHHSLQAIKGLVIKDFSKARQGVCSSSLLTSTLNKCMILSDVEAVSKGCTTRSTWEGSGWDEEFLRHHISMAHICRSRRDKERVLFKAAVAAREAGRLELAEGCLMRLKQSLKVVDNQSQSSIIQPIKNFQNKIRIKHENSNSCDLFNTNNSCSALVESCSMNNSDDDIFMDDDDGDVVGRAEWLLEEAALRWCKGGQHEALHLVKTLVVQEPPSLLMVKALVKMGDWLVDSQSESPSFIIESCYEKALNTLKTLRSSTKGGDCPPFARQECLIALDAHRSLASYTHTQYTLKAQYMQSSVFEDRMKLMRESGEEVEKMKKMKQAKGQYFTTIHKQLQIDKGELSKTQQDARSFLLTAIFNYLKCLRLTSDDTCTYKLTSLWFDNYNVDQVNDLIKEHLDSLPSHTFVNLMYQVAARMSLDDNLFQHNIRKLVGRCTKDHPHHVLPIIFSLSNAKRQQNKPADTGEDGRIRAAKRLVEELQEDREMGGLVRGMQWLNLAYIDLSFLDASAHRNDTKPIKLPSNCALNNINKHSNTHLVAMPTLQLPISPKGDYSNITYITSINATFSLAGGLNLPKIIMCHCSDGVVRKQLVKGKDDLRQDAVMQQVFSCVNQCLRRDEGARRRGLCVRTYKVVPLSQQSGVLEWCNKTQSLGDYLCHPDHGAHLRYRPKDLKPLDCRRAMNKAHSDGSEKVKLATYKKVCASFRPALRHFFFENFTSASIWVQRRLAYTASVSTNSIVGYVLGLGDRHIQNILIDKNTAELIHIDFGVAFEQGWNLPTPETVPFRLTRDLVDAMGVLGVEGPFRRYCEKTLVALKAWKEILMTILQVMLHDPMYHWSINKSLTRPTCNNNLTCAQLQDKYGTSRQGGNKVAERVLSRVRDKLQGFECGGQLSVEGHVSHLIQVATDPNNLSKLFPGWQAYV